MKICVTQSKPKIGEIKQNIQNHQKLIDLAVSREADMIIFPELSLTGYEPKQVKSLVIDPDDSRLDVFQKISDAHNMIIGIGMPTGKDTAIFISMVIFQPKLPRQVYSKKHLHPDEEAYFSSGDNLPVLSVYHTKIALSICYEISIPEHAENAFKNGATIYVASVAKSESGIKDALLRLSEIAKKYAMTVLMANCIGRNEGQIFAGLSSVWNKDGQLISQLDQAHKGIIMYDTESQEIMDKKV